MSLHVVLDLTHYTTPRLREVFLHARQFTVLYTYIYILEYILYQVKMKGI